MSKLFKALLISAVATAAAAVMVNRMRPRASGSQANDSEHDKFVDAEKLSEQERALLSNELDAML